MMKLGLLLIAPHYIRAFAPHHDITPVAKPHVLFALVDDLGFADTEDSGGDDGLIKTPHFQKLLEKGVKLDRMYSYSWCGPSRSSLLSGRTPPQVDVVYVNEIMAYNSTMTPYNTVGNGIPAAMTTIGTKMKEAGYYTAYVGKWGAGYTWMEQSPKYRGFDEFFGYLQDSVSFWTQTRDADSVSTFSGCEALENPDGSFMFGPPYTADLWRYKELPEGTINGPADLENNTGWVDYQFLDETMRIIGDYDPDSGKPLFMFHSFHSIHTPLDPPDEIFDIYKDSPKVHMMRGRRAYAGMVTWTDGAVGKMVDAFKAKRMWDNTIMVMSTDNGGPTYGGSLVSNGMPFPPLYGGANNFPLRGSKTTEFEGGLRLNSFVSGGIIPAQMHGTHMDIGYMHISDWYATFIGLAGGSTYDALAAKHGTPQSDSVSLWPLISGASTEPVRKELYISPTCLIDGDYKIITGRDLDNINGAGVTKAGIPETHIVFASYNPGYGVYAMTPPNQIILADCTGGCLFDIRNDPSERYDLSSTHPKKVKMMKAKLAMYNKKKLYQPYRGGEEVNVEGCSKMRKKGFVGPWYTIEDWVMESDVVSKPLMKGRGKRGVSTCQGRIDGHLDCDGTKDICANPEFYSTDPKERAGVLAPAY
jgi:arylsulfatase I/J